MALLSLCDGARAGGFRVYTCTILDQQQGLGPTIVYPNLPSGWDFSWSGTVFATMSDHCHLADRFAFGVHGGPPMTAGQSVWVRWTTAPGTQLTGLTATWAALSDLNPSRGDGTAQLTAATDQQTLLAQNTPLSISFGVAGKPRFEPSVVPAHWFEIRFTCLDQCSTALDPALYAYVLSAQFDVDDPSPPTGGLVGTAIDAQTWSGHMRFGLNAADVGGGVFRAVVEVDGADVLPVALGDAAGTCHDIAPDPGLNGFAAAQPCPLRIDDGSLDIDTAGLPQGQHVVRILLEDAAGNRTTIFGPLTRNITTSGAIGPGSDSTLRGAANGDGASDLARLTAHWGRRGGRTLLVSSFGRAHVVRGRLRTADGAPIANGAIDVVSKTTAVNARELSKRVGPRTGSDGSWYVVLPRGVSSRDVTFRYRSHVNDTIASATASVRLRVRAGLRLAIHPRRARQGQAIRFSGRLLGGPLPRGGKQVVLMARASRGAWVRFNVVRTDLRGRFRTTYRFQQPGAALYRFRALSLSEAAYPYLAGGSNVVKVRKG
ncbi:MAG TPA: hypothetical protein VFY45_00815 [Baekduia sp.]|nr:hypothetical protein [Baekduia sp.]